MHRNAGDLSTLSAAEQPFSCTRDWVVAEGVAAEGGGTASSFTRIVISDLKPDVLQQMLDDERGVHICQVRGAPLSLAQLPHACGVRCQPAEHP